MEKERGGGWEGGGSEDRMRGVREEWGEG